MPILTGCRNDVVYTKYGHVVRFRQNEDTNVPDVALVVQMCLDRGHTAKSEVPKTEPVEPEVEPPKTEPKRPRTKTTQ